MAAKDETARTPTAQDGDASGHTSTAAPTPEDGQTGQPAAAADDNAARIALANKLKAEKLNTLMERAGVASVEELEARVTQSPAAPTPIAPHQNGQVDYETRSAEREAQINELRVGAAQYAKEGDKLAALTLDLERRLIETEQRVDDLSQGTAEGFVLNGIRDPKLRNRVAEHLNGNRHRVDMKAAIAEVRVSDLEKEAQELRDRLKVLETPRDPDVVGAVTVGGREITATDRSKLMPRSQFLARVAALEKAGKVTDALKLRESVRDGSVELDYEK